jgi:hypothetical protein
MFLCFHRHKRSLHQVHDVKGTYTELDVKYYGLYYTDVNQTKFTQQLLKYNPNTKFHQNPSSSVLVIKHANGRTGKISSL